MRYGGNVGLGWPWVANFGGRDGCKLVQELGRSLHICKLQLHNTRHDYRLASENPCSGEPVVRARRAMARKCAHASNRAEADADMLLERALAGLMWTIGTVEASPAYANVLT